MTPRPKRIPLVLSKDLERVLLTVVLLPISWLLPSRYWRPIGSALARATGLPTRRRRENEQRRIPPFMSQLMHSTPEEANRVFVAGWHEEFLASLRSHRPGGWHPLITLVGQERLDRALTYGHGAILWIADFEFSSVVAKMALARAGFRVTHLSRPGHPYSPSWLAEHFLNSIQVRVEERYLYERVVMTPEDSIGSLRRLRQRLAEGGIVSISVGQVASQNTVVPLFDGHLVLATGPVTLARASSAPLLPVFTLRISADTFRAVIEAPLQTAGGRGDDLPFRQYAALLAGYLRSNPGAWQGWQKGWTRQPTSL